LLLRAGGRAQARLPALLAGARGAGAAAAGGCVPRRIRMPA